MISYVLTNQLKSPIFPILTPIPGSQYHTEIREKIILNYDYFDYAHSVLPTKLTPRDFYESWIKLYYKSYPVGKNLKYLFLNKLAKLFGDSDRQNRYSYLNLRNLSILRIFGIFARLKLIRHYRSLVVSDER